MANVFVFLKRSVCFNTTKITRDVFYTIPVSNACIFKAFFRRSKSKTAANVRSGVELASRNRLVLVRHLAKAAVLLLLLPTTISAQAPMFSIENNFFGRHPKEVDHFWELVVICTLDFVFN